MITTLQVQIVLIYDTSTIFTNQLLTVYGFKKAQVMLGSKFSIHYVMIKVLFEVALKWCLNMLIPLC
jgi:hypothetical protein